MQNLTDKEKVKRDIVENLYWDIRVDASDVKVEVTDTGSVTLSGTVPYYSSKSAASTCVWSTIGVTSLTNNLKVNYRDNAVVPSDDEIEDNIRKSILWNNDVDLNGISISVKDHVVTLEGKTNNNWSKNKIELLSDITGVQDIRNNIVVSPKVKKSRNEIQGLIYEAFRRNSAIDEGAINIDVQDTIIKLTGSVKNWSEYNAAEEVAIYTDGVTDVENNIKINYS